MEPLSVNQVHFVQPVESEKMVSKAEHVVCVRNDDYPASLEVLKVYRVVVDPEAATSGLIRIFDESEEDYLYPSDYFLPIDLP